MTRKLNFSKVNDIDLARQIDIEIQLAYYGTWAERATFYLSKMLAEKDEYINEAFKHLEMVSQNKEKQIAYTSRLKALTDYNSIMEERYETGRQEGRQKGIEIGEKKGRQDGRQELLKELMEMGIPLPDGLLSDIKNK